jgi:hypothetical protein
MGFFQLPEPSEDDRFAEDDDDEFDDPSAHWVGGVVPVELVVARSEQAGVVVRGIVAYPDGFAFTLESFLHRSVKRSRRRRPFHAFGRWDDEDDTMSDETLRFGISWPDGGRATNLDGWGRGWPDATEPAHGMEEGSGGGSDRHYSWEYWAWPLPDSGPLRFVCEWPAYGIPETFAPVDAALFADAVGRAFPVWPDDAGRSSHLTRGAMFRTVRAHEVDG